MEVLLVTFIVIWIFISVLLSAIFKFGAFCTDFSTLNYADTDVHVDKGARSIVSICTIEFNTIITVGAFILLPNRFNTQRFYSDTAKRSSDRRRQNFLKEI